MASGPLITTINDISIHALREEGDCIPLRSVTAFAGFLSTPSARRATRATRSAGDTIWLFLSTPSARRATRLHVTKTCRV